MKFHMKLKSKVSVISFVAQVSSKSRILCCLFDDSDSFGGLRFLDFIEVKFLRY